MTTNLTIADNFTGAPGAIVTVPISISDAAGLQSLDITLQYDTNVLTIVDPNPDTTENEGVNRTGVAENWIVTKGEGDNPEEELSNPTANVNQETGEVKISLINPLEPLTEASGEIIAIDFQVRPEAGFCTNAAINLQEAEFGINDERIIVGDSELDDGIITVKPDITDSFTVTESEFTNNPIQFMDKIEDFDGNNLGSPEGWKQIGSIDVQGDDDIEYVFVNPTIGRWATVGADITGIVNFGNHGHCGDTRVVGIYEDPLIALGIVEKGSDFDSQRRFQNDLLIDNLTLIPNSDMDYDGDGLQNIYFKVNDGTAVLHALMHADGNIQYANYQSEADLEQFMTTNNIDSAIWGDWF